MNKHSIRSPFPWFGGKGSSKIRKIILEALPPHRFYVEPFGGGASIADKLCISGGFPCQDISSCGKGEGISGKKSSLWLEMARVIREVQPAYVFAENSPLLACRGLEVVLASLAEMGYDAKWCVLGAGHLGYPTKRERLWLLGRHHIHHGKRHDAQQGSAAHPAVKVWSSEKFGALQNVDCNRMLADGCFARTPDGVADWMDRVKAIGNGQVPAGVRRNKKYQKNSLSPAFPFYIPPGFYEIGFRLNHGFCFSQNEKEEISKCRWDCYIQTYIHFYIQKRAKNCRFFAFGD